MSSFEHLLDNQFLQGFWDGIILTLREFNMSDKESKFRQVLENDGFDDDLIDYLILVKDIEDVKLL